MVLGNHIVRPFFPPNLTGEVYPNMLEDATDLKTKIIEDDQNVDRFHFQRDGAYAHYVVTAREF